jgi:signal transduction histidine kinase
MSAIIDHTVDVVRRISAELRPSVLDDLGLAAALRLQTKQFQDRTGIVTECDCFEENLGLNQQLSTALFRVFEEALTNVMRHAGATKVEIRLKRNKGDLVLTIRDNGRGITEAEMLYPSSLGLLGMRERVNLIGGELNITGTEGEGTMVTVRLLGSARP